MNKKSTKTWFSHPRSSCKKRVCLTSYAHAQPPVPLEAPDSDRLDFPKDPGRARADMDAHVLPPQMALLVYAPRNPPKMEAIWLSQVTA